MKTEQQRLQQKETDRKRLEQLLTEVANLLDNSPRQLDARPISSLKGRLPPPLRTAVLQAFGSQRRDRSEEHTSELQSRENLVCRLLLEKKNKTAHCS